MITPARAAIGLLTAMLLPWDQVPIEDRLTPENENGPE